MNNLNYTEITQKDIDKFLELFEKTNQEAMDILNNKVKITQEKGRGFYEEECIRVNKKLEAIILDFKKHK